MKRLSRTCVLTLVSKVKTHWLQVLGKTEKQWEAEIGGYTREAIEKMERQIAARSKKGGR